MKDESHDRPPKPSPAGDGMKKASERLHYMDALRSAAMFLGVVFHASVFFAYWPIDPFRPHPDASVILHYLNEIIHTFRMELFFLVAGFFAVMLCRSRGWRGYMRNRVYRIAIPFVLCVFLLEPWIAGECVRQNTFSDDGFWSHYLTRLFDPSYLIDRPFPEGNWFWHFWFLHLLMYFAFALVVIWVVGTRLGIRSDRFQPLLNGVRGSQGLILLTLLTYPLLLFSPPWADVPGIGTSLDVLIYYGLFFFAGAIFFLDESVFQGFHRQVKWHVLPYGMAMVVLFYLVDALRTQAPLELLNQNYSLFATLPDQVDLMGPVPLVTHQLNWTGLGAPWEWHLMCLVRAYTTWCGIAFFIVFFRSFCRRENPIGRYASDASYFVYLLHFPVQMILIGFLREHVSSALLGFWICLLVSTLLCVLLYHVGCRNTALGSLLSGRRYPLDFAHEWKALKTAITSRTSVGIGLVLLVVCFTAESLGQRSEKAFLANALIAHPAPMAAFAEGRSAESLSAIRRPDGRNALHMASHHLQIKRPEKDIGETLRQLLGWGFDPNGGDGVGQTPLHYAVRFGNQTALAILLEADADPNVQEDRFGQTPLHLAATMGLSDLIDPLVEAGGRWDLPRRDGVTPKDLLARFHPE